MTVPSFSEGDEPAIRRAVGDHGKIADYACPFCGSASLLASSTDLKLDTERVEVYCDNSHCAAREIVILIKRGDPGPGTRADVLALQAVDRGTVEEQEADGYTIERDEHGNPMGRTISLRVAAKTLLQPDYDERKLDRRLRPVQVTVTPLIDADDVAL
jgi:hypothetical protein